MYLLFTVTVDILRPVAAVEVMLTIPKPLERLQLEEVLVVVVMMVKKTLEEEGGEVHIPIQAVIQAAPAVPA